MGGSGHGPEGDSGRNTGPLGRGECGGRPALDTACEPRGGHGGHRQAHCLCPAILELSVKLDPALVKNAVQAHKKAVDAMGPDFVTPLKNHEDVTIALAKMFAAAPKDKIKAVFDATPGVQDLNSAWYAQMPQADAQATFEAFKELANVVNTAPTKAVAPVAVPSMDGPIGMAAKKLADASYPLISSIDWAGTGVLDKYVVSTPANKAGISALLDAGLAMDPKLIQGATKAHLDALNAVDGKL